MSKLPPMFEVVRADLRQAILIQTGLIQVNLSEAELRGVDLSRANMVETTLKGAKYHDKTKWPPGFDTSRTQAVYNERDPW
jgi:uncharacterized protein YjbI with pentapeptide repeats